MFLNVQLAPWPLVTFRPRVGIEPGNDLADDIRTVKIWLGIPRGRTQVNKHGQTISTEYIQLRRTKHCGYSPNKTRFDVARVRLPPNTIVIAGISLWCKSSNEPIVHPVVGIVLPKLDVTPYFCSSRQDPRLEITMSGVCPICPEDAAAICTQRWLEENPGANNGDEV
jgi:hypothetical protein